MLARRQTQITKRNAYELGIKVDLADQVALVRSDRAQAKLPVLYPLEFEWVAEAAELHRADLDVTGKVAPHLQRIDGQPGRKRGYGQVVLGRPQFVDQLQSAIDHGEANLGARKQISEWLKAFN